MIFISALLGLLEVFVFWQLDIWGATVVAFLGLLFAFRNDARLTELILASVVYSFVVSIFVNPIEGLIEMFAVSFAALCTIVSFRVLLDSRLKKIANMLRYLYFAVMFNVIYLMIAGLRFIGDYNMHQLIGTAAFTVAISAVGLMFIDTIPLKRKEESLS